MTLFHIISHYHRGHYREQPRKAQSFKPGMNGRSLSGQGWRQDSLRVRFGVESIVRWLHFDILGYRNGPVMAESQQESKTRHRHVVELPETSAPEE